MVFKNLILKVPYVLFIFILASNYQSVWCQNRITGGQKTNIKNFPYMLRFQVKNTHSCGASIIGKEWGLTAGHCFDNAKNKEITVLGGTTDIKNREKTATVHRVTKYYVHEKYKPDAIIGYDIAVFKVNPPFKYSAVMKAIQLPQQGKKVDKSYGLIAGWGLTKTNGTGSPQLLYAKVPQIPIATCRKQFSKKGYSIQDGEICYGYFEKNRIRDSCQGDSGGPLVNKNNIEIGVVSWGIGACGEYPGVYADTSYFRNWIKRKSGI